MQQQKLSPYILEGAEKRPQAFDDYIDDNGRTCALGAAYEAITATLPLGNTIEAEQQMLKTIENAADIRGVVIPYPPDTELHGFALYPNILDLVVYLNDRCHWTREQIADYLESLGYQRNETHSTTKALSRASDRTASQSSWYEPRRSKASNGQHGLLKASQGTAQPQSVDGVVQEI